MKPDDRPEQLRRRLEELGGVRVAHAADGPFVRELFVVSGVRVSLEAEYGTWWANLAYADGPLAPAAYWLAALDGHDTVPPDEPTQDALPDLVDRLPDLLRRAAELAPAVEAMVSAYRAQRAAELRPDTLSALLDEIVGLLSDTEPRWARSFTTLANEARSASDRAARRAVASQVLSLYGGMGSFSDLVLQDSSRALPAQVALDHLRSRLFEAARSALAEKRERA